MMSEIDMEQARFNMVEQQIRTWDVLDQRVLDALMLVPREEYVPRAYRHLAYADIALPLNHGEYMLHPKIEARLLQALQVSDSDIGLVVGTGSGYLTALMAHLGQKVYSVDINRDFLQNAAQILSTQGVHNVELIEGDASRGWPANAPYDVIAVCGGLSAIPAETREQLAIGGRLVAVVGHPPIMEMMLVTRLSDDQWRSESLLETELALLRNAEADPTFEF